MVEKKIENKAEEKEVAKEIKAEKKPVKLKLDLDKIVSKVQTGFGKDKSSAAQINTGASISRPNRDCDYILWEHEDKTKKSPWESLTNTRGLIYGRVTVISGKPDSGKSTHAAKFMKLAQDQGAICVLVDTENKFSKIRFTKFFNGNADEILITTSKMILEGANHVEQFIHAIYEQNPKQKVLVIIDSVGGNLARNEDDEHTMDGGKQLAAAAKENAVFLRGMTRLMEKYKNKENNEEMIAVLLITQTYATIGIGPSVQKEKGGEAITYYASIIVQLSRKADLSKTKDNIKYKIGIETRARVKKNHLSDSEMSVAELPLIITAGGIELLSEKKVKSSGDEETEIEE